MGAFLNINTKAQSPMTYKHYLYPTRNSKLHIYCQKVKPFIFNEMITLKSLFTSNIFLAIIFNVVYVYFFTKHFINSVSTHLRSKVCLKQAAQPWLLDNASTQQCRVTISKHY